VTTDELFRLVVPEARLSSSFATLRSGSGFAPARAMMQRVYEQLGDRDGNFREQFQTTGFDARTWELYLFAALTNAGYELDRTHAVPDFVLHGHGRSWAVEATTANPGPGSALQAPDDPRERQRYIDHELPIRLGSPLFSKLSRRYWEEPQVQGMPFVLALESFASEDALTFSETAIADYLYGTRSIAEVGPDGRLTVHNAEIAEHRNADKNIPSGFFQQPGAENVSAVLFSNQGTVGKFGRMAYQEGLERGKLRMFRRGLRATLDPDAAVPSEFVYEVGSRWESWSEGLVLIHNPGALLPLPDDILSQATHYRREGDDIVATSPSFHAFGSITITVDPVANSEGKQTR
jgi:hypothetical protein